MKSLYLIVPFAPLAGALIAGLLGWLIGRRAAHVVTIAGRNSSAVATRCRRARRKEAMMEFFMVRW